MRIYLCGMGVGVSIMEFDAETRYRPTHMDLEELINGQNEMIRILSHKIIEDPSANKTSIIEICSQVLGAFMDIKQLQDE